jgi:hypothetical protein
MYVAGGEAFPENVKNQKFGGTNHGVSTKEDSQPWCIGGRQHHHYKAPFKNKTYQSIRIRYGEHARERKSRREPLTSTKVTADSDHFLFIQQRGAILRCIRSSTISTPSSCTRYKNAFPGYFVPELELRGHPTNMRVPVQSSVHFPVSRLSGEAFQKNVLLQHHLLLYTKVASIDVENSIATKETTRMFVRWLEVKLMLLTVVTHGLVSFDRI